MRTFLVTVLIMLAYIGLVAVCNAQDPRIVDASTIEFKQEKRINLDFLTESLNDLIRQRDSLAERVVNEQEHIEDMNEKIEIRRGTIAQAQAYLERQDADGTGINWNDIHLIGG